MASLRPSNTPPVPRASAETWAVRLSIGGMIVAMAAVVVYDLLDPRTAPAEEPEAAERDTDTTAADRPPLKAKNTTRPGSRAGKVSFAADDDDTEPEREPIAGLPHGRPGVNELSSESGRLPVPHVRPNSRRGFLGSSMNRTSDTSRETVMPSRPTMPDRVDSPPPPPPPPEPVATPEPAPEPAPQPEPEQPQPEVEQPQPEQPEQPGQPEQPEGSEQPEQPGNPEEPVR